MAEIICVIGNKGGTGKTTLSHMLCQGLGLLNQRSVCVLTDVGREPLDPDGRRYLTADARSRESLSKVVDKIRGLNKWIGVIDGGANRSDMDRHLYSLAHLVLLPFRDSHEDMRTVQQDLDAFPRALALPMQWPTNSWAREAADRTVESQLGAYRNRILEPVFAISSSKQLLQKRIPDTLPSPLANACRRVAAPILDILRIEHEEVDIDADDTMEEHLPAHARNALDATAGTH
jgi:chromosome partitioning protein